MLIYIILGIFLIPSIILNIFQYIYNQKAIAAVIDSVTDMAVDKINNPQIWPCEMILMRVIFNTSQDNQIVDFSQYEENGIVSFDITKRRSPASKREEEINGEVIIIAPGAVYSPTEGVFKWVAQPQ